MRVIIVGADPVATIDTASGWRVDAAPAPCHRCGVCCERWQPLLTPADAARLAAHLGLTPADFHRRFTAPYPFDDEQRLLQQEDGHCVFLRWAEGRAACAVHTARPGVCRAWAAGLDKKECVQGLARFAGADGLIQIGDLYPDADDRAEFLRAVATAGPFA